jgi:hypothetical protein
MLSRQKNGIQPKPGRQTHSPIQLSNIQPRSRRMLSLSRPRYWGRPPVLSDSLIKEGEPRNQSTGKFPEPLGTIPEPLVLKENRRKIQEKEHHRRECTVSPYV